MPVKDGTIRTAKVKLDNTIVLRPIQKLYPLENDANREVLTNAFRFLAYVNIRGLLWFESSYDKQNLQNRERFGET